MLTYKKTELMSSTEIVRNFSSILDSITKHEKDKIAVLRKKQSGSDYYICRRI